MSEEKTVPSLTLEPQMTTAAATMAAEIKAEAEAEAEEKKETPVEKLDLSSLEPAEQAAVREFSEKIDIMNTEQVINYGGAAQKNISEFSEAALNTVRTKDLGKVGDMISSLVVELKGLSFEDQQKKGFLGLFRKAKQDIASLAVQYDKADANVDKIVESLENHELNLLKDISLMDKMYEKNEEYLKELTMYILAGKLKLEHLREVELPEYKKKALESGLPEDAQKANDFANMIGRFEKKIHDLELTRNISIQMAPQIRLIQNNDNLMVEKIRTSIVNTIPLWKNQMVLAMSMYNSEQAMKAQREVTDVTNSLLQQNAAALHQGSVDVAREAERGIVDLETLRKTNDELIKTLDEVRQIQDDGRARRAQAEEELGRLEGELKQKLLEMKG